MFIIFLVNWLSILWTQDYGQDYDGYTGTRSQTGETDTQEKSILFFNFTVPKTIHGTRIYDILQKDFNLLSLIVVWWSGRILF